MKVGFDATILINGYKFSSGSSMASIPYVQDKKKDTLKSVSFFAALEFLKCLGPEKPLLRNLPLHRAFIPCMWRSSCKPSSSKDIRKVSWIFPLSFVIIANFSEICPLFFCHSCEERQLTFVFPSLRINAYIVCRTCRKGEPGMMLVRCNPMMNAGRSAAYGDGTLVLAPIFRLPTPIL